MRVSSKNPIFENRYDAGRQLAARLAEYKGQPVVVLAIPNGGVPIALGVALALEADLDLVISRKIPLPLSPEGGFGAVTDDGTTILNEEVVRKAGLTAQQINYQVAKVRMDIRQRSLLYHKDRPIISVSGKTVLIVDDGLASGYTMMAAIASLRKRRPGQLIAAVPIASEIAQKEVAKVADKLVTCAPDFPLPFYLADFYRHWNEPDDNEVLRCLRECRLKHPPRMPAKANNLSLEKPGYPPRRYQARP